MYNFEIENKTDKTIDEIINIIIKNKINNKEAIKILSTIIISINELDKIGEEAWQKDD